MTKTKHKIPKSLAEVLSWKEAVNDQIKHLPPADRMKAINQVADELLESHGYKKYKTPKGMRITHTKQLET